MGCWPSVCRSLSFLDTLPRPTKDDAKSSRGGLVTTVSQKAQQRKKSNPGVRSVAHESWMAQSLKGTVSHHKATLFNFAGACNELTVTPHITWQYLLCGPVRGRGLCRGRSFRWLPSCVTLPAGSCSLQKRSAWPATCMIVWHPMAHPRRRATLNCWWCNAGAVSQRLHKLALHHQWFHECTSTAPVLRQWYHGLCWDHNHPGSRQGHKPIDTMDLSAESPSTH